MRSLIGIDICLLSCTSLICLRVTLYTSVEMKTQHPATWPSTWRRFLQVRVVLTTLRDDLCPYLVIAVLPQCALQTIHCHCLPVANKHILTSSPLSHAGPSLPVLPHRSIMQKERCVWWRRLSRHLKYLFCCWLTKKKKSQQQLLKAFSASHQHRIGHRLCGHRERLPCCRCVLTFPKDNRKANNTWCLAQVASSSHLVDFI